MPMQSQESTGSSSGQFDSEPRRSRIHFPFDESSPPRLLPRTTDAATRTLPRAARTSPSHRRSPLNPRIPPSRRRVRSAGTTADVFAEPPPSRTQLSNGIMTPPRATGSHSERDFDAMEGNGIGHNIFTDEYDLYPKILQDVQRALKLKARREARLSNQSTPPRPELASSRPQRTVSLTVHPVSPISPNLRKESMPSDVDFSPSTGAALLHPVPTSLDNGLTLDWSGFDDKHESRWKLTGGKRKGKEVMPPTATAMEQQEIAYAGEHLLTGFKALRMLSCFEDKLGRLKGMASSNTIKKAKVTQDQLERRYNLVYNLLSAGQTPNIAKVSRWYRKQDTSTRNALEKAEPFMWVRHLEKRSPRPAERSPWYISAIIAEEYLRSRSRQDSMTTIYEDSPFHEGSYESPTSPSIFDSQKPVPSRPMSNEILGPSIARTLSFEDGLTFEPRVNSTRTSLEVQSQESSFSSLPIGSSSTAPSSPTRGRGHPREASSLPLSSFSSRIQERLAGPLLSEESDNGDIKDQRSPMTSPDMNIKVVLASDDSDDEAASKTALPVPPTAPNPSDTNPPKTESDLPSPPLRPTIPNRQKIRASLPPADRTSKSSEVLQQQAADEEKAYEIKLRLLEQTSAANHRIRQLLNRVSGAIREYDTVQSNAMASLGIAHIGLPRELIDAFGHDPAAVTGATRRVQGWKAVDDIQHRLVRQREVFRAFLSRAQNEVPQTKSVLEDPISSLVQSLKALELHSDVIAGRAFEVGEALKAVQETHDKVKTDYNNTLARTSAVYPELSQIIALEERYKDQYQQFWEFGMDTLTFILDTVTPFWRSYGKLIGEDMRDFLIIPLYRNEFTGETKRYPISRMPTRSPRHWLGLVLFFFASITMAFLQVRAALSSSALYKLQMIPYESVRWTALPFFWLSIVVQWWAVVAESVIVLLQLGVVVWWAGWSVRLFT
ncbi:hypothetical protein H0H92_000187 [Tricholoma furcatifolium]|nr:hypothetical protein H0H92_000187 [Tricholoma furcatifolium]